MTATTTGTAPGGELQPRTDLVTLTIDGVEVSVPKGTLVIRAAEQLGIAIPRFCDHPLLDPVGACRQCLVDVEGQMKPLASCTTTVTEGMVVRTQRTSPMADKAQHGVMEQLLINHPLDCPVCDKGGECPLQNQALSNGRGETRFEGAKRTFPKPVALSSAILLDRERCISCARCTRFAAQVAGDPLITLVERGARQQVACADDRPFHSYYSGNTVQICPVGALTGTAYRFRSRPFDLVSVPTACEHCAAGCALRTDYRRSTVLRRLAGDDPAVNEEWNCDKGRWAFRHADTGDRLAGPLVRSDDGELVAASWPEALTLAARGLAAARAGRGAAVLVGGRSTLEDAYAYAKFARLALGTHDIDFRARPHSAEEADFLAAHVAGRGLGELATYADLDAAPAVLLVGLEPEDESPIVLLRLRKALLRRGMPVFTVAPFASSGLAKVRGRLLAASPGGEPAVLTALAARSRAGKGDLPEAARLLREPGAVVLVGERAAEVPGTLSAVSALLAATGAGLGWVPRRAGERGALDAGALPTLLPGGRPVAAAAARVDVAAVWGVDSLPAEPGRDATALLAAAGAGELGALVVGGVDLDDLDDPVAAAAALDAVPFLVSLEVRHSAVTERADVVLPVAPVAEKAGTFVDWEGRPRSFPQVLSGSPAMSDARVLTMLAGELDVALGLGTAEAARREIAELGPWQGTRGSAPSVPGAPAPKAGAGQAVLATWRLLLDAGRMQDGAPELAGTARPAVARASGATAAAVGVADGELLTVATEHGAVTVPLVVDALPDGVVWLPTHSAGCSVRATLRVGAGAVVRLSPGGAA